MDEKFTAKGIEQTKAEIGKDNKIKLNLFVILGPPPQRIEVTGPTRVTFNSESEFGCRAASSQPPARLSWRINVNNVTVDMGEGLDNESEKVKPVLITRLFSV